MLIDKYVFRGNCLLTDTNGDTLVTGPCYYCQSPQTVAVKKSDLNRFRDGVYAQNCFPYLSPDEREFLISGICAKCWHEMFAPEEDDDDDGE